MESNAVPQSKTHHSYNCSVQDPMSAVILNDGFNMLTGEDVKKRSSRSAGMVQWIRVRCSLPDAMTYTTSASNARIKKNSIMLQDVTGSLNIYS